MGKNVRSNYKYNWNSPPQEIICGHGHEKNLNIPSPKTAREVKCPIPGPKQSIKSLPYAMISIDWIPRDFRLSTKPEFLVARRNFSRIGDRTSRNFEPFNIVSNPISWMDNSSRCWWNVRISCPIIMWNWLDIFKVWSDSIRWPTVIFSPGHDVEQKKSRSFHESPWWHITMKQMAGWPLNTQKIHRFLTFDTAQASRSPF